MTPPEGNQSLQAGRIPAHKKYIITPFLNISSTSAASIIICLLHIWINWMFKSIFQSELRTNIQMRTTRPLLRDSYLQKVVAVHSHCSVCSDVTHNCPDTSSITSISKSFCVSLSRSPVSWKHFCYIQQGFLGQQCGVICSCCMHLVLGFEPDTANLRCRSPVPCDQIHVGN